MIYDFQKSSFIEPRKKSLLKNDTIFWLWFVGISTAILLSLYAVLSYEVHQIKEASKKATLDRKFLSAEAIRLKNDYEILKRELSFAQDIKNSNILLKDNIANIFAIIPDQITLSKVEISSDCLVIYGRTPSKEIYDLHLAPALKSIFTTSETSFAKSSTGGLKFISINKTPGEKDENAGH